eukprot:GEMP01020520.1.p1 GENE.GEMP01020520.1~~GEMP01020520.1.p1  ORF type:complete len:307 (+),score=62.91 GEMP01020520.1:480-1400(+)
MRGIGRVMLAIMTGWKARAHTLYDRGDGDDAMVLHIRPGPLVNDDNNRSTIGPHDGQVSEWRNASRVVGEPPSDAVPTIAQTKNDTPEGSANLTIEKTEGVNSTMDVRHAPTLEDDHLVLARDLAAEHAKCSVEHCDKCVVHTHCDKCWPQYVLAKNKTKCAAMCGVRHCEECQDPARCDKCDSTHRLTDDKTQCSNCLVPHCSKCSDKNTVCEICVVGTPDEQGHCEDVFQWRESSNNMALIGGLSFSAFFILIVVICAYFGYCSDKDVNEDDEEENPDDDVHRAPVAKHGISVPIYERDGNLKT